MSTRSTCLFLQSAEAHALCSRVSIPSESARKARSARRTRRTGVLNQRVLFSDWSLVEKQIISWYVHRIEEILHINAPKMVPRYWNLAKCPSATDPHTIEHMIVLPSSTISNAVEAYKFQQKGVEGARHPYIQQEAHVQIARTKNASNIVDMFHILFRELAHIYLRLSCRRDKLDGIYRRNWGFERIDSRSIQIGPEYVNRQVLTPSPCEKYLFHIQYHGVRKTYLPMNILMSQSGGKIDTVLVEMCDDGNNVWTTSNRFYRAQNLPLYTKRFNGMERQLYHPEKILVNFMSDYVVSNIRYIDDNPAAVDLYRDIDRLTGKNNA